MSEPIDVTGAAQRRLEREAEREYREQSLRLLGEITIERDTLRSEVERLKADRTELFYGLRAMRTCFRSHPHEKMDFECRALTVLDRETNAEANRRADVAPAVPDSFAASKRRTELDYYRAMSVAHGAEVAISTAGAADWPLSACYAFIAAAGRLRDLRDAADRASNETPAERKP